MESWTSYPSIYNLGHAAVAELFSGPVIVEEKIDGSQFAFGVDDDGELRVRSKGKEIQLGAPEKMFAKAVQTAKGLAPLLKPDWTYRAEFLSKPHHNALAYGRVPEKNLILFDVSTGLESYLSVHEKSKEAGRLGLEVVPLLFEGVVAGTEQFVALLETTSILGGQKIEGVVIKPAGYGLFGRDKKCLMGKYVSPAYREVHAHQWKQANPQSGDILERICSQYRAETRWAKAVQHLLESGTLENSPRDIGALILEVPEDVERECGDEIRHVLWSWAWPQIRRGIIRGLPEWYKAKLLEKQFAPE